jgi:ParB-like chromosome segregation protein Spo0J
VGAQSYAERMVRIDPALEHLLVPLDAIHQHPDNPNNGDLDSLTESIRVNGFYSPIIVNEAGQIIAGNHRYQAMIGLGATHIPAVCVDADSEATIRMMLADNKITRNGWDDGAIVAALLKDLAETDIGIIGTGWNEDDLARMAAEADTPLHFGNEEGVVMQVICADTDSAADLAAELIERGFEVHSALT